MTFLLPEWPKLHEFEPWRPYNCWYAERSVYCLNYAGVYPYPEVVYVPKEYLAFQLFSEPPESVEKKRGAGIRVVEDMMSRCFHDINPARESWDRLGFKIYRWRWFTDHQNKDGLAVIAKIHGCCQACGDRMAYWPLSNSTARFCMRCLAVMHLANHFVSEGQDPATMIDATEIALTQRCGSRRQWGRRPVGWKKEDWTEINDRNLRSDAAKVALLSGLLGPNKVDLSGITDEAHRRIALEIRCGFRPAPPRYLPCAPGGVEGEGGRGQADGRSEGDRNRGEHPGAPDRTEAHGPAGRDQGQAQADHEAPTQEGGWPLGPGQAGQ